MTKDMPVQTPVSVLDDKGECAANLFTLSAPEAALRNGRAGPGQLLQKQP